MFFVHVFFGGVGLFVGWLVCLFVFLPKYTGIIVRCAILVHEESCLLRKSRDADVTVLRLMKNVVLLHVRRDVHTGLIYILKPI